jgi:ech hydrogenase subunit F
MSILRMSTLIFGNFFKKPYTKMYPIRKWEPYKNTRGSIQVEIDKCIFCSICQKRCPAQAITVDKNTKKWEINRLRCIMCNYCVEVCPKKCLSAINHYAAPSPDKVTFVYEQHQAPSPEAEETAAG